MKRMFELGLLALPLFLAASTKAHAQGCGLPGGNCARGPVIGWAGQNNAHMGCGGFCFRFLGGIHQHGPLYNYGPYVGYYPFAPYGPWDASLNWVGPNLVQGSCGWHHLFGNRGRGGCGTAHCSSSDYSLTTFRNVGQRVSPLSHWGKGKSSCSSCTASVDTKPANEVVQTGYPRTER